MELDVPMCTVKLVHNQYPKTQKQLSNPKPQSPQQCLYKCHTCLVPTCILGGKDFNLSQHSVMFSEARLSHLCAPLLHAHVIVSGQTAKTGEGLDYVSSREGRLWVTLGPIYAHFTVRQKQNFEGV